MSTAQHDEKHSSLKGHDILRMSTAQLDGKNSHLSKAMTYYACQQHSLMEKTLISLRP
jgi:hypothetical protein